MQRVVLLTSLIAVFAPITTANAASVVITTDDGIGSDAHVRGGIFAAENYGANDLMGVKNDPNIDFHRKVYLRFDLTCMDRPIEDAILRIAISGSTATPLPQSFTYRVYGLVPTSADDWVEGDGLIKSPSTTGITWSNAPANITSSGSEFTDDATLLGSFVIPPSIPVGNQVTFQSAPLADFINDDPDGSITLMISRVEVSAHAHNFASREHETLPPPTLGAPDQPDLDASGTVNGFDLAMLLAAWGPCEPTPDGCLICSADLNADGIVNGIDLALLLGEWG